MAEKKAQNVVIDGKKYALDSLSDQARAQLNNLRITEGEIDRLNAQLAIAQTARSAYASVLQDELASTSAKQEETTPAKKKAPAKRTSSRRTASSSTRKD